MPSDRQAIQQYFYKMNRILTWSLVVLLALVSAIFWLLGYASTDVYSIEIGLVFMGLAVVFYKLPYVSYWVTKRRFRAHQTAAGLLDGDWKSFRTWIDQA